MCRQQHSEDFLSIPEQTLFLCEKKKKLSNLYHLQKFSQELSEFLRINHHRVWNCLPCVRNKIIGKTHSMENSYLLPLVHFLSFNGKFLDLWQRFFDSSVETTFYASSERFEKKRVRKKEILSICISEQNSCHTFVRKWLDREVKFAPTCPEEHSDEKFLF